MKSVHFKKKISMTKKKVVRIFLENWRELLKIFFLKYIFKKFLPPQYLWPKFLPPQYLWQVYAPVYIYQAFSIPPI